MKKMIPLSLFFMIFCVCAYIHAKEVTTVQSDTAHYDGKEILLKGSVIVENSLGKIEAQDAKLMRADVKSKIDFPKVELCQNVIARLYNGSKLHCDLVRLDYDSLSGFFQGNSTDQVYYCDEMGEIYADRAEVNYACIDGSYKPIKITLIDHVQLINRNAENKEKEALQFALADIVEYFPSDESMILKAHHGKKVLFFDKGKDMQLSAGMVKGKRDEKSGTQSIQGIGDVRFTFGQEELEKIKKHFKIE